MPTNYLTGERPKPILSEQQLTGLPTDVFGFTKEQVADFFGIDSLTAGGVAKLSNTGGNLSEDEKTAVRALTPEKIQNIQSGLQILSQHPSGSHYTGDTMKTISSVLANFGRGIAALFTVGLSEIPVGNKRLGEVTRAEAYASTVVSGGQLTSGVEGTEKTIWSTTGKVVLGASLAAAGPSIFDGGEVGSGFGAEHFNPTSPVDLFGMQGPLLESGAFYAGPNAVGIGTGSVAGSALGAAPAASGTNPFTILVNQVTGQIKSFAVGLLENVINPIIHPNPVSPTPANPGTPTTPVVGVPNLFGNWGGGGGSGLGVLPDTGKAGLMQNPSVLYPVIGLSAIGVIWFFFLRR